MLGFAMLGPGPCQSACRARFAATGAARPRRAASASLGSKQKSPEACEDLEIIAPGFEPRRQFSHLQRYPLGRSTRA
jgi:hypothetical protein